MSFLVYIYELVTGRCWHEWGDWSSPAEDRYGYSSQIRVCYKCKKIIKQQI